ncbi:hypothetical protein MBLNU13_g10595t2 [Cladosporium sp. NU13]
MKTVIQRVKSASVTVDGELVSTIGKGLLIFAALSKEDTIKEAQSMASKVLKAKLWDGEDGKKWNCNVQDIEGEVLCVSQFTLLASTKKGNKPSFHKAASPTLGRELYSSFIGQVRSLYREDRVKDGVFGAMMDVGLVNDGPVGVDFRCIDEAVTILIDSDPPAMDNPSGLQPPEDGETTMKGHIHKTFELPASLLE